MECGDLARTGVSGLERLLRRSTSITIRATPATAQINWFDASGRGLRRDGLRPRARARRAADDRDRDAHLPGDPHRHRIVPLLEHLAADVRHLPRGARGRRRSGAGRAQRLRQQQHGPAEAVRRGAERDADRPDRPHRHRLPRSRDGARRRRHLRRHRRADQPAADGEGDPGGGVLQAGAEGDEYRVSLRSKGDVDIGAVAKEFGGGGHKNAAGCTVSGRASTRCSKTFVEKIETRDRWTACCVVDKPAGPTSHDVVARVRRALGERADRPHRHARSAGDRRAAAGRRPGDAARAVPERAATSRTTRSSASGSRPTPTTRRASRVGARSRGRAAVARRRSTPRSTRSAARSCSSRRRSRRRKIDGQRSYKLARRDASADARRQLRRRGPPRLDPPPVQRRPSHAPRDRERRRRTRVTLRVDCSAGFYVRSLAHDLGERLGVGAHLAALRRTRERRLRARRRGAARRRRARSGAARSRRSCRSRRCCRGSPPSSLTAEGRRPRRRTASDARPGRPDAPRLPAGGRLAAVREAAGPARRAGRRSPSRRAAGLLHPSVVLM